MKKTLSKTDTRLWSQKVLLHDHLCGSITMMPILKKLFELSGKPYPFSGSLANQHKQVKRLFNNAQIDIVKKFSNTTGVLQTREALALAAENYVKVRAEQGFEYCEAMIAPQYQTFGGLRVTEVIEALIFGIKRGEAVYPKTEVNIIFTVGREIDPNLAVDLVNAASYCDREYVVGIGLACDEAAHPPEKHKKMFKRAKELGFKTTCHAGEWASAKPDYIRDEQALLNNIRTALFDLNADRLGHAIPLGRDEGLMTYVAANHIAVEGCPGSNLASGLIPNMRYLGIDKLLARGICYSLNPDDDLFLPSLDETFRLCDNEYHFSADQKMRLQENAWKAAFALRYRKDHV